MLEEYRYGSRGIIIIGDAGRYVVRACGNHKVLSDEFSTVEEARAWLYNYYPGVTHFG